jgi:hypothetical protein
MCKQVRFDSLCEKIRAAYSSLDHHIHDMYWTFLYTPQSTLRCSQQLFFLGLNPGGKEGEYKEISSCEKGNAYLVGNWDQKKGEAPLQCQVQKLFKRIEGSMSTRIDYRDMMNSSLAANYVPFRSSTWNKLGNRKDTLEFAEKLWSEILDCVCPRAIVCMSKVVYEPLKGILKRKGFDFISEQKNCVGWGKETYNLTELRGGEKTVVLVRLPHLSRYKIFSRQKCDSEIKKVTDKIASVLDANAFLHF